MRVGEIWKHKKEEVTIRITDLYKRILYLDMVDGSLDEKLFDFIEYKVVDDPSKDSVAEGEMPAWVLIDLYSKVYE